MIKKPITLEDGKLKRMGPGEFTAPLFSIFKVEDEVSIQQNSQMIVDSLEITSSGSLEIAGNLRII